MSRGRRFTPAAIFGKLGYIFYNIHKHVIKYSSINDYKENYTINNINFSIFFSIHHLNIRKADSGFTRLYVFVISHFI